MPACCIVKCGLRKNKNQPQLTLHRFPRNESLRKQWLEAVGKKNINPQHKEWYLCSLHFEENCFNRTLDVIRLRDNSVPTIFTVGNIKKQTDFLYGTGNTKRSDVACTTVVMPSLQLLHQTVTTVNEKVVENKEVKALKEQCAKQKLKIKRLNEKIRRQNKKIANLKDILEDFQRKN